MVTGPLDVNFVMVSELSNIPHLIPLYAPLKLSAYLFFFFQLFEWSFSITAIIKFLKG